MLDYPVGLITADEVAMAGGKYGTRNKSYYLFTNTSYWTGSPATFNGDNATTFDESSGTLSPPISISDLGVRPVISLSPSVKLSGNGTWNNVYEVVN